MVEMKNVTSGYGKIQVLHGVNLTAKRGKITTLIGSNGSGKSTLLHTLLKAIPLTDGDITVDGKSIKGMAQGELAKKIAYLPQGKNVPDISAGRMVLHGRFPYLSYPRKYRERDFCIAEEAMEKMGILELAKKQMAELSGGMRQKVYIAMALAQQAPAIVMDEPTTYLDIGQQLKFAGMIKDLSRDGKTIILVLHDILLALKISDWIAVMRDGKIIREGTPGEILGSGVIPMIYGVDVKEARTDSGVQYYYEEAKKRESVQTTMLLS